MDPPPLPLLFPLKTCFINSNLSSNRFGGKLFQPTTWSHILLGNMLASLHKGSIELLPATYVF